MDQPDPQRGCQSKGGPDGYIPQQQLATDSVRNGKGTSKRAFFAAVVSSVTSATPPPRPILPSAISPLSIVPPPTPSGACSASVLRPLADSSSRPLVGPSTSALPLAGFDSSYPPLVVPVTSASPLVG